MIDFGRGEVVGFETLLEELIDITNDSAEVLDCTDEIRATREIIKRGTSADRQRKVYQKHIDEGGDAEEALKSVARSLVEEFTQGL